MAANHRIFHHAEQTLYELVGPERVNVTDRTTGRQGVFDIKGRWISGDILAIDKQLLTIMRAPDKGTKLATATNAEIR